MGSSPGQQDDGLEQAGLARRIGPPDQLWPGPEVDLEQRVAAQVADGEGLEQDRLPGWARPPQEVVRTGMTTWVYASSPIGRKTPGESGPLSSSANCSADTF